VRGEVGDKVGDGIGDCVELAARVKRLPVSLGQHLALRLAEVEHFGAVSVAMVVSRAGPLPDVSLARGAWRRTTQAPPSVDLR
jgi:hypothetical protein